MLVFSLVFLLYFSAAPCFGQEAPIIGAKKFDYSADFRHNVCDRQRMLYNGEIEVRDALDGLELSVYLTNFVDSSEDYMFALTKEGTIDSENPGLIVKFLDEIAKRARFTWRNQYATFKPPNTEEDGNKTWTDLLLWSIESYDISADYWDKSIARMSMGVSYPENWFDNSLIMVDIVAPPSTDIQLWAFLRPFEYTVWVVIGLSIFISGLVYYLLESIDATADERQLEDKPWACVFLAAITFTGHFEFKPNTSAARLWSFSWSFWALLTGSAYTANLASFLVKENLPDFPVASIEEAVRLKTSICVRGGSNQHEYMKRNYPDANMILKGEVDGVRELVQSLLNKECEIAAFGKNSYEKFIKDTELNSDCSLTWVGRTVHNIPSGFATSVDTGTYCTSLISYVIDLYMHEMKADGFFENEWNKVKDNFGEQSCGEGNGDTSGKRSNSDESLGMKDMGGIFLLHGLFSVASISLALVQYYLTKKKMQTSTERERLHASQRSSIWGPKRTNDLALEVSAPTDSRRKKYQETQSIWQSENVRIGTDENGNTRTQTNANSMWNTSGSPVKDKNNAEDCQKNTSPAVPHGGHDLTNIPEEDSLGSESFPGEASSTTSQGESNS